MKNCILFLLSFYSAQYVKDKELFLIPKGYIGSITILHSQKDGRKEEYIGNRRAYHIPSCGTLKTQFPEQFGIVEDVHDHFLFVYTHNGITTDTIPYLTNFEDIDSNHLDRVYVYCRINGGFQNEQYNFRKIVQYGLDSLKNIRKYNTLNFDIPAKMEKCK